MLAHFNPAIAERFNNTIAYFGSATIASMAGDAASAANEALDVSRKEIKSLKSKLVTSTSELADLKLKHTATLGEIERFSCPS
jgi:hypothetical protein